MVPTFPFTNLQNHTLKPRVATPTRVLEQTRTLTNKQSPQFSSKFDVTAVYITL